MAKSKSGQLDALKRFVSSFQQFEKKLDKLQSDINFQGHTLSELRVMVASIADDDVKRETVKSKKKNMAIQYEKVSHQSDSFGAKKKDTFRSLPTKAKYKPPNFKTRSDSVINPHRRSPREEKVPKAAIATKLHRRLRNVEPPRKANTMKSPKIRKMKKDTLR